MRPTINGNQTSSGIGASKVRRSRVVRALRLHVDNGSTPVTSEFDCQIVYIKQSKNMMLSVKGKIKIEADKVILSRYSLWSSN